MVKGLGTLLPGVLTLLIYRPRFVRLARNSNSRGFARQTVIIRCGQMSADTKVSTQTGFSAYSEVSIALIIFMHDYSERRGQLRWRASDVARCARQQKENGKETLPAYWPSVPLCVHSNCTELHYLQRAQEVALCSRAVTHPCEKNHVKTNKSGNLYMGGGVGRV